MELIDKSNNKMPTPKDLFCISGPAHLTSVDWRKPDHRSSVAASLVQGVYTMERNSKGTEAPKWWEFFHFQCMHILKHPVDCNIVGAVFEYKGPSSNELQHHQNDCPTHVIAFRGTIPKKKEDLLLDLALPLKGLLTSKRYKIGYEAVEGLITKIGPKNVWLAGHSLGAAIALQIGKDMAKRGTCIDTYLFNPPFYSMPLEMIKKQKLKSVIRVSKTVLTTGAYHVTKCIRKHKNSVPNPDPFSKLGSWIPNVFVNPKDPISCEYIGYFENRERIEASPACEIVKSVAAKHTMMNMVCYVLGRRGEPPHLVPSALLTKNMICMDQDIFVAHGLSQWWKSHDDWQHKLYVYVGSNDVSATS